MSYEELKWTCGDGSSQFGCIWTPERSDAIPAVVGIVHGMGEHMGRYSHVAEMLLAEGYAVIGFDQRGHGRTEGKRGHTPTYEALMEGLDRIIATAKSRFAGIPLFLYGHSMGGNVTLNYLLRRKPELAGAIVTGPWLKLAFKPPSLQAIVGKMVELVYPKFTSNRPLNAGNLTSDPDMIQRYVEDELGHGQITARFFFGVQRAGQWALDHASELRVPLLLMHAEDDKVTSSKASKQFADNAKSPVDWVSWPDFKHELHNDLGREEVFVVIRAWIKARLASPRNNS